MAGKLQLAAKVLLGTTLMGSGTGGVYYATTHDWTGASQTAEAKQPATSDLDAVMSAWTAPAAKKSADADSSPVARSAEKAPVEAKAAKLANKDRYETPTKSPEPAKAANDDTTKDVKEVVATEKKPIPEKTEPTPAKADDKKSEKVAEAKSPTPAIRVPEPEIARGQEPKDDLPPAAVPVKDISADISGAFDAAPNGSSLPAGGAMKEPKPLNTPTQPTNIADSAQRAKQAFGGPTAPAASDRYGGGPLPAPTSPGQLKPATVNPFGATPLAASPTSGKSDRLEALPQAPREMGGSLRELQPPPSDGMRPMNAAPMNSSSPAAQRTAARDYGAKDRLPAASPYANTPASSAGSFQASPITGPLGATDKIPQSISGDGTGKPGEKALEGAQHPTLIIQKFAPGEIQVGKPAKFVMQVRNAGTQAADNVIVQDEIPQGTQLVSTTPAASTEGTRLTWQLGKLSAGEDRTIEMQLMPKAEGDIGSVATVTYSAQASVKTHCTMPQLAIRMTAPGEVMIGKQQHVKIEIRNPGSGDATGVMLFENVPPNVKHAAGPTLEFEIGTLKAGETRELDLVLNAEKAGKVVNVLSARAQGNLQVQQQVEFEVIAPGLTVALQGPERRYLERPATYEVSVQNPGTAPAHDVQIVTKLPKGMRFVKANNMGEYDSTSHAVYWSLAELPKGEPGKVELTVMPVETGPQTMQVEGRAQQGLSDKTQREIMVEGLAAIKFEVRSLQDPVEVGGEASYEIRVVNQGTKAATNVQVSADLPAGFKLVSAEGETQHKSDQNRLLFEPLQQLAPKADTVYRIRAQAMQPGDQRLVVQVKTDDIDQPIRREENTRVFGDQ